MEPSVSAVGVLDKAVAVLAALEDGPTSLGELVAATGLARPTAHRLAVALEAHGLVRRDDDGRFALGLRLVALGRAASEGLALVEVAHPALAALREETGESVQLYVRDGDTRVCVASLESPHGLRTIVRVGAALPLDRGSAGRALLGRPGDLVQGWVESVGEREAGVASVSAPVVDHDGRVRAAVGVSGPIERTTRSPGRRYGPAVVRAARAVEEAAGLRPVSRSERGGARVPGRGGGGAPP
ncbi:MAG: IclR family transcriptional regulator [Actinomycetota bacterium]|nr:IclR family transcriptional regulator [Actinomycetota bacterium]